MKLGHQNPLSSSDRWEPKAWGQAPTDRREPNAPTRRGAAALAGVETESSWSKELGTREEMELGHIIPFKPSKLSEYHPKCGTCPVPGIVSPKLLFSRPR